MAACGLARGVTKLRKQRAEVIKRKVRIALADMSLSNSFSALLMRREL